MKKARGSGHYFGVFLLIVVALAVFAVSVTLSLTFFQGITPPDKSWFPYFGLSLTEGGFLCWLGAFLWVRHHAFHTFVEFTMTCLSLAGIVATAGVELFSLMPGTTIDVHAALFANVVGMVLEAIFLANIISVFIAAIVFYSEANPGWFRGGGGSAQSDYVIQEQRGETARPLASSRRHNQPKEEPKSLPASLDQEAEIEEFPEEEETRQELKPLPPMRKPKKTSQQVYRNPEKGILSEGASTLTQKLSGFIGNTRMAVRVRGRTNQTTNENM